ncbi:hypothetical protein [Enterococcus casseliflavus]|uniref:hypothetical protein n=1 Tax=Enterococcus casseliflavus TaxID=37734 RepID=UPI0034D1FB58
MRWFSHIVDILSAYKIPFTNYSIFSLFAKRKSNEFLAKGYTIAIADVEYVYTYDDDSKSYLNKVYELATSGLIDNATFNLLKGNVEDTLTVDKVNITELWLLSFLHEEELKKALNEKIQQIESAESIRDLQEIE